LVCLFPIFANILNYKTKVFRKLKNSELKRATLEEFKEKQKLPIIIVLDNVRSQHNIGSSFRTSDAFAIEKVYLCGICATPPSAEIRKAALGAEESMDWQYFENTADAVVKLREDGYTIVSVEQTENSQMLDKFTIVTGNKYAFIFGNEVKGVAQDIVNMSDAILEIPQYGTKHSLNISVSVGVVLWEITKQIDRSF